MDSSILSKDLVSEKGFKTDNAMYGSLSSEEWILDIIDIEVR